MWLKSKLTQKTEKGNKTTTGMFHCPNTQRKASGQA
jgi:hypothetical protein